MKYPTLEEVEEATHIQICRWYRFLKSPGSDHIYSNNFDEMLKKEAAIMNRISERLDEFGGFNSTISKQIGWS